MARGQVVPNLSLKVVKGNPVSEKVSFEGWIQLEYGYEQHGDTWYEHHLLKDNTGWLEFIGQKREYVFYKIAKILLNRIKSQGSSITLYSEWMTISEEETVISRTVFNIWDVFGKVGGISHVITLLTSFIFI
jgi:hypothetical protein